MFPVIPQDHSSIQHRLHDIQTMIQRLNAELDSYDFSEEIEDRQTIHELEGIQTALEFYEAEKGFRETQLTFC